MKRFALILLLFWPWLLFAQYLEVSRSATIREEPNSSSIILERVDNGDRLVLLRDGEQTNGYYSVKCKSTDQEGWIYRTLVRRYDDPIPVPEAEDDTGNSVDVYGIGAIPAGYYDGTENLNGVALKLTLHRIIRNHKVFTYDQVWDALSFTDSDPQNPSNVILLYTKRSQRKEQRDRGTTFDYAANGYTLIDSWNREHVWAKSHGFPEETDTAYTDLHHLRPADRSTNSARNERSFDYCNQQYLDNGGTIETDCYTSTTNWAWEPPDEVKGDVARMIFYMTVRYEGYLVNGVLTRDLEVVDYCPPKNTKDPIIGKLSTLLKWHEEDPVDNWERRRNDIIYNKYQGNRNPFIDHPEFVEFLW